MPNNCFLWLVFSLVLGREPAKRSRTEHIGGIEPSKEQWVLAESR